MKFALLGIDDESLRLVREIARSEGHQLCLFAPATELAAAESHVAEVRRLCPLAEELADWELLLAPNTSDAVIVAGPPGAAGRFDQLRRLVQEAIPVFVTHPPAASLLEAYELEMVRQEVKSPLWSVLLPWRSGIWNETKVPRSADAAIAKQPCDFDQVVCERLLTDRTRASVLGNLGRDIDFIRDLCGEITQVATLSGLASNLGSDGQDMSALTVQMTTDRRILVRWSVEPAAGKAGMRLTLSGRQRKHRVEILEGARGDSILYSIIPDASMAGASGDIETPPRRLGFVAEHVGAVRNGNPPPSNWPSAIRSLEIVEAVEKSLKKGRTIAVGIEGRSETDAFKGTMASIGCVLLMLGLLVVFGSAVILKLAEKTGNQLLVDIFRWWPAGLVAVFGVFILMQLLRFIIPRQPRQD